MADIGRSGSLLGSRVLILVLLVCCSVSIQGVAAKCPSESSYEVGSCRASGSEGIPLGIGEFGCVGNDPCPVETPDA